ncbi:myosin-G heavy chain-like, partial [Aphidius gifuensis]|uniref:myosin-G heavy chain-like n=1 Tax=Aphidius gifuensis TaxID=684658 RepID=UPI001CDBF707
CEPYSRRDLWYLNRPRPLRPNPCIRLSQPNLIDHIKKPQLQPSPGKKVRLSQPNLHISQVRITQKSSSSPQPPQSQSSIESQDSCTYNDITRSTCPPSYSPSSQRSRYSQPNLPTLTIPYNDKKNDRRMRYSQPTLNSSYSGINFINTINNKRSQLSYSSLRNSGDTSINNFNIHEDRLLSQPNFNSFIDSNATIYRTRTGSGCSIISPNRRLSSTSPSRFLFNQQLPQSAFKRERLSQPTLVTGDYYPHKQPIQRLSQPCLLTTWNEKTINTIQSPLIQQQQQKFIPIIPKGNQRERLSQLDFGITKYRLSKDFTITNKNFNRDRFSIPELETKNDLRAIAGTPKQRFSLDSQLNSDNNNKIRRLLPIASSPISEIQINNNLLNVTNNKYNNNNINNRRPSDSLEGIIIATATPLLPSNDRKYLSPILQSSSSSTKTTTASSLLCKKKLSVPNIIGTRERMSVPEIRNSSLRRLLDPPLRQRHSITGNLRQLSITSNDYYQDNDLLSDIIIPEIAETKDNNDTIINNSNSKIIDDDKTMPKHIQRHYSYTYDKNDDVKKIIGKLSVSMEKKKKYLESNFDENEQVITTVIETETPLLLSSPKYMKKTHVYSTTGDTPKWLKKCLDNDDKLKLNNNDNSNIKNDKTKNILINNNDKKILTKDEKLKIIENKDKKVKSKNTMIRIKSTGNIGENKYEVAINSNWSETDICRLYGLDCDSNDDDNDDEDSTSV